LLSTGRAVLVIADLLLTPQRAHRIDRRRPVRRNDRGQHRHTDNDDHHGRRHVPGSLWARKAWGVWWEWDPRLTMALLLELVFRGGLIMRRRFFAVCSSLAWIALPLIAMAQAAGSQEGYVPITDLPPAQQLPAAPFLIAAYAFIWLALLAYLWSIRRRLGTIQREIRVLDARSHRGSGPRS
jgi:CcmD family protein